MVVFTSPFLLAGLIATTFGIGLAWGGIAVLRAPPKAGGGATAEPETWTTMPNSPLSRFVGGLLVATGLPVALLGGLCTGWIVVPETVLLWNAHRLWSIGDL